MFASAELQADYSVVMQAVKHGRGNGLLWANQSLLANRSIILAAIRGGQGEAYALAHASPDLKVDHELAHAAMDVDCIIYTNLTWDQQRALGPETARKYIRQLIEEREWDFVRAAVGEGSPGRVFPPQDRIAYPYVVFNEVAARGWNIHRLPARYCYCRACSEQTPPCQRYIPPFHCTCCSEGASSALRLCPDSF